MPAMGPATPWASWAAGTAFPRGSSTSGTWRRRTRSMTTSSARGWPLISRAMFPLLLTLVACADLERGPRPETPDAGPITDASAGDGGGPAFAEVRALVVRDCAGCHAAGREAGGTSFLLGTDPAADYRAVRALVDPANPAGSRLLGKAAGQGHGGGAVWQPGSPEQTKVLAWIAG